MEKLTDYLISAFSLKAFSTESLDDGIPGSINSLRRPSCPKTRGLSTNAATAVSAAKRTPSTGQSKDVN